jgi:nucleotide-binding universal stress UspA family protein
MSDRPVFGPGSEIDGFVLGERIHAGAMALIFRLEGTNGPLPLIMKIPRLGQGEPAANVISFEVERLVLGSLFSRHVPTLVAMGDVETTPYLVMEYIQGPLLSEWSDRAPAATDEIVRLGSALAIALHELHRRDVVHLDVKPANVLYRAGGEAVLIDFGLAHHSHLPDLLAEEFRAPVGNWPYMSPEQVLGVRCDPRSDLFALGAVLYELATGRLPFGTPTSIGSLRSRLHREPAPPRAIRPDTPEWLQEIILRCLEIDANDRYASGTEVAFDLAHPGQVAITERGKRLRAQGWGIRLRRWWRAAGYEPAPCPPPSAQSAEAPIVLVALATREHDAALFEALRGAVRQLLAADDRCRIACIAVVPPEPTLGAERFEDSATSLHIKHLVELHNWARPLQLPEERLTYHVIESNKPADALIDFAKFNDVRWIYLGARSSHADSRPSIGNVAARVVAEAPCSVTVMRA